MKNISRMAILCFLLVCFHTGKAQHVPRPNLFNEYPTTLTCPVSELAKIFNLVTGQMVQLTFSDKSFTGIIATTKHTYTNLQNVVVKLANLQGAIFHVSKITNPDNTTRYTGRIINEKFGDGYELKNNSGNYYLEKIKTDDVIQD